jgi:hypothetical protein
MRKAGRELPESKVSDDFNARLLDRVARERFAETRTQAYLPKPAPLFLWRQAVPVAITAVLALFAGITMFGSSDQNSGTYLADRGGLDDSYLTAQPANNPNMIPGFGGEVSLPQLMAKVDRADEISNFLTGSRDFGGVSRTGGLSWTAMRTRVRTPFNDYHYTVRPVIRVTAPVTSKEENGAY